MSLRGSAVRDRGNLMKTRDGSRAPIPAMTDLTSKVKETSPTRSQYEHPCSDNEHPGVQNMNTKEYTVKGSTRKEYTVTVKEDARKKQKRVPEEAHASSSLTSHLDSNKATLCS